MIIYTYTYTQGILSLNYTKFIANFVNIYSSNNSQVRRVIKVNLSYPINIYKQVTQILFLNQKGNNIIKSKSIQLARLNYGYFRQMAPNKHIIIACSVFKTTSGDMFIIQSRLTITIGDNERLNRGEKLLRDIIELEQGVTLSQTAKEERGSLCHTGVIAAHTGQITESKALILYVPREAGLTLYVYPELRLIV